MNKYLTSLSGNALKQVIEYFIQIEENLSRIDINIIDFSIVMLKKYSYFKIHPSELRIQVTFKNVEFIFKN